MVVSIRSQDLRDASYLRQALAVLEPVDRGDGVSTSLAFQDVTGPDSQGRQGRGNDFQLQDRSLNWSRD